MIISGGRNVELREFDQYGVVMPDYFSMDGLPGRVYFRCERQRATLSTEACAASWRRADELNNGQCSACRLCPVGAVHAGEVAASMSPLKGTLTCARCHRASGRLIGGMVCVSCYNRAREFVVGKNAKGTSPVKTADLCPRKVRFRCGDAIKSFRLSLSRDMDELVVATLRDSRKSVAFAFNSEPPAAIKQLRLW